MSEIKDLESIATKAVHRLRQETLTSGQPFMINVSSLPENQCYFEYPDKSIKLVMFLKEKKDFSPLKNLTSRDRDRLRKRLGLV
ncbi:hypothetical protein EWM62_09465 [Mucilaginibacter terrigena]|uniref:Uncharacterized protein n=1 Tax=Mucilaginibacter terrigena TaxID=2492395 RepID=A0A4Q5LME7_9SPHI|nr:hypothetical protein [Mucilaginibacter terrigena]RYU90858.1 hypothetical protein EWM62_09465 [Mucilaginibacter terrigena]